MTVTGARIVSLVPSITELLFALGLGERVVGRTGFCIHPREAVRHVPKVGGTKTVRLDAIRALAPTHVVVNVEENRREDFEALREFVPHVIVTYPRKPEDNPPLYRMLGDAFGCERAAESLCARFDAALDQARAATARLAREQVLYLIWREPWMAATPGTYIGATLAAVGWDLLPREAPIAYPRIDLEALAADADLVLLSSEPYRFTAAHAGEIAGIPAVRGRPVLLVDGEMTSWYGDRAITGMRYLTALRTALA